MPDQTVVVGGGLAGLTAALRLADAGLQVTLVEGRPRLGGAACSFHRDGLTIDNGQHVFLRCCTAYRELLTRIGATPRTTLQPHLDIPVLHPDGRRGRLARTPGIPAPLHLTAALARYRLLSAGDRARVGRAALALRLLDPADPSLDTRSFGEFLRRHGQSDAAIEALWGVVGTATLNAHPDDGSLALAAKVFRTGLLDHADAADVGYAAAPLGSLHDDAARRALAAAGVEVLLGHRVRQAQPGEVRISGRTGERTLSADSVVLAVPVGEVVALAPGLVARRVPDLGASPIVNVHLIYDRRVTDLPFAAAVGSPVQWFFDRSQTSGLRDVHPARQYLAITVSAADDVIDVPSRQLIDRFAAAMADLLPAAAHAEIVDAFVTRERRATFRQAPGTAALRPGPDVGIPGVAVAGAWTATGWPDTMESAVRSGAAAAEHLLARPSAADALEVAV